MRMSMVGLNWSLEVAFANHIWMYVQNASRGVQVITREKVFLYHKCYVLHSYFKHS